MESVGDLKQKVLEHLQQSGRFSNSRLQAAYLTQSREQPLVQPTLVVGIQSVEVAGGSLGGYLGSQTGASLYGAGAHITMSLDIFVPSDLGAQEAEKQFETLCDVLVLTQNPFGITKLVCKEIVFDTKLRVLRLPVQAKLYGALTARDTSACIENVIFKKE